MKAHLELGSGDHRLLFLFFQESRVDRVELATFLRVGEDLMSFLDALEEGVVICVLVDVDAEESRGGVRGRCTCAGSLFIRVVLEDFLAVYVVYVVCWKGRVGDKVE